MNHNAAKGFLGLWPPLLPTPEASSIQKVPLPPDSTSVGATFVWPTQMRSHIMPFGLRKYENNS